LDAVSSLKILKEQYMSFGAELIDMLWTTLRFKSWKLHRPRSFLQISKQRVLHSAFITGNTHFRRTEPHLDCWSQTSPRRHSHRPSQIQRSTRRLFPCFEIFEQINQPIKSSQPVNLLFCGV
jgi:hypothetical protein